jgi:hypothetical protein
MNASRIAGFLGKQPSFPTSDFSEHHKIAPATFLNGYVGKKYKTTLQDVLSIKKREHPK